MDLMVRVETVTDDGAYGWVLESCEHSVTLQVPDNDVDRPGWIITVPWDQVIRLIEVTEFMTRTLTTEDA
ncbi:hypothetical protein [Nocardioides humi]|nr:hypothetical protein [Nocardioides humi]